MQGRGIDRCLICDQNGKHIIFNSLQIIYGIKLLFDTDEVIISQQFDIFRFIFSLHFQFNVMLQSTFICIKCAGRLHQLFDFNLIKTNLDSRHQEPDEETAGQCQFCESAEFMGLGHVEQVKQALMGTKWAEVRLNCGLRMRRPLKAHC